MVQKRLLRRLITSLLITVTLFPALGEALFSTFANLHQPLPIAFAAETLVVSHAFFCRTSFCTRWFIESAT